MGRPGNGTSTMRHFCKYLRWDVANELSAIVSVERTKNKAIAASNYPFADDTLMLLIGNMGQYGSYSNENRNIEASERPGSVYTLMRERSMRFHKRRGVPATK